MHQPVTDCKSEAGSLLPCLFRNIRLFKLLEDQLLFFLWNTDPVILYGKGKQGTAVRLLRFRYGQYDMSVLSRIFYCIAQQINEDLIDPEFIAEEPFMQQICFLLKYNIFFHYFCIQKCPEFSDPFCQIAFFFHQMHLAAFDL